jgi:hypothetical protein
VRFQQVDGAHHHRQLPLPKQQCSCTVFTPVLKSNDNKFFF